MMVEDDEKDKEMSMNSIMWWYKNIILDISNINKFCLKT